MTERDNKFQTNDNLYKENIQKKENKVYCMCKPISEIRNKSAQELLELCGQTDRVPVDLRALLSKLNISCIARDFSEIEAIEKNKGKDVSPILGALVTNGNNAVIFIRDKDQENGHRYRFTIAHELAHACLGHFSIGKASVHLRRENDSEDGQEFDANVFAGQLLIPKKSLDKKLAEILFPSVAVLADIFAVSQNVMKARLEHLEISDKIVGYNC